MVGRDRPRWPARWAIPNPRKPCGPRRLSSLRLLPQASTSETHAHTTPAASLLPTQTGAPMPCPQIAWEILSLRERQTEGRNEAQTLPPASFRTYASELADGSHRQGTRLSQARAFGNAQGKCISSCFLDPSCLRPANDK